MATSACKSVGETTLTTSHSSPNFSKSVKALQSCSEATFDLVASLGSKTPTNSQKLNLFILKSAYNICILLLTFQRYVPK